jgi:hypothetical protein
LKTLQEYLVLAQRHFNRREYEQFIMPIVKCLEQQISTSNLIAIREPINKYIDKCKVDIDNTSENTINDEEIISTDKVKEILDTNRSLIL